MARDVEAELEGTERVNDGLGLGRLGTSNSMGKSSGVYSNGFQGASGGASSYGTQATGWRKEMERSNHLSSGRNGSNWATQAQKRSAVLMGPISGGPNRVNGSSVGSSATTGSVAGKSDAGRAVNSDRSRGVRHLSYSEVMERKSKGLCFRYGEKYHPMHHQCALRKLRVLVLGDDEMQDGS